METIRVLHSFAGLDRGGAETMIMNIYNNINRDKVQFDFVTTHSEIKYAYEDIINNLGGKIYFIPKFNGKNIVQYRNSWSNLLKNNKDYKILHIHNISSASLFIDIAQKMSLVTIIHSHFGGGEKNFRSRVQALLRLPLKYQGDYLVACSKNAEEYVFGKNRKDVTIINNAIETERFTYKKDLREFKRKELGVSDEVVLGHVGRFVKTKNHTYIIDIFNEYHKINKNCILLLIGTGELIEEIKEKVEKYNLTGKVKFMGDRSDVHELLQAMDVFIFPSIYEGLPVTLIEAQASGLPIIASDTITTEVEITDLFHFKSITENPERWSKKIEEIIPYNRKNYHNDIVDCGFDIKSIALKMQNYYENIFKKIY